MKFTANLFLAASVFCLAACSENNNTGSTESASLDDISAPASPALSPVATPAPGLEAAAGNQPAGPLNPAASSAKVNPPHGQPGHDCAIPVGAPMDGSAAATTPDQNAVPKADVNVTTFGDAPVVAPAPAVAGMNPPHGQPGHDCAIPVGAPLKK